VSKMKKQDYSGLLPLVFAGMFLALIGMFSWAPPAISQGYIDPGAIIPGTNTYFLQSGATYADWFDLFGSANTFSTKQTIDPSSTSVEGLEIDMPSGTTENGYVLEYNNVDRHWSKVDADESLIRLQSADLGNDISGPYIYLGRNNNATSPGAGHLRFVDKGAQVYYLHFDDSGNLRGGTAAPVGSADTTNSRIGGENVGDVKMASYQTAAAGTSTYYQALNLTSSGYIDEIIVMRDHTNGDVTWSGEHCYIQINIDGGGAQTLSPVNLTPFSADDVMAGYDTSGTDAFSGRRIILGGARFDTSVDIDYMQASGATEDLRCIVHYREDQ
jgi:hypothetical protein